MTHRWIVTALGKDRPGIVAGVSNVLFQLNCNLEDSTMTRLEGEFAIMLIFSSPRSLSAERLQRAFQPLQRRLALVVHVKPLSRQETRTPRTQGRRHLISVYGADRTGIVSRVSEFLARSHINITDLHTHRSTGGGPSLYLMLLEVEVPVRLSLAAFEGRLRRFAKPLGVELTVRPAETNVL